MGSILDLLRELSSVCGVVSGTCSEGEMRSVPKWYDDVFKARNEGTWSM